LKGNIIARKAGTGRVKATEIDEAIGSYIPKSAVLNTDTARNYQNFALINGLKHELINDSKKERVRKGIFHIQNVNNLKRMKIYSYKLQVTIFHK
jgi:hypothetical protein